MLSTDVGAAPAASTIQDGAPFVGARRDAGQPPDDFAAMFDRCAGATADAAGARPPKALQKGVAGQPDQTASSLVATATTLSVSAGDEAAPAVDPDDTLGVDVEFADEGEPSGDLGVQAFDPRFFVPVALPVPIASPTPTAASQPDTPAGTPEVALAGYGRVPAPATAAVLPVHARGPVAAFPDLTPRPMAPVTGMMQRLPIDEPIDDPTMPVELDGVAVDGFDPAALELSTTDVTLTPEQRAAIQDAVNRLASGAAPAETAQADGTGASAILGAPSVPADTDARRVALSSLRTALAASAQGSQPTVATTPDAPVSVLPDAAVAGETPSVVAEGDALPPGLSQAISAAPQRAMSGLHHAVTHASRTADTPVALQADAPEVATVSAEPMAVVEATPSASLPAETAADRATSEAVAPQAVQGAQGPKTLLSTETDGSPAPARVRGNAARQVVPDAPAPASRPSARVAHAIAAFQAAAHAAGTPPAAAQAVFTAAAIPTALLDRELPTQIVQSIRVQFDNGSGEARVRLNPGFLGGMTVGVDVNGTSVVASLQASSAEVREWLQRNEQVLRQALADQGLHLDRLVIVEEEAKPGTDDEAGNRSSQQQQERQPQRRPRRPADEGTFDVEL